MAGGHTTRVIVSQAVRKREAYRELGADYYDRLRPERLTRHLVHRLEQLGHTVAFEDQTVEDPQAPPE
jgi:hypothetical protein